MYVKIICIIINKVIQYYTLQDKRNFVRSPPVGVDFCFNYETSYPVALAILAEDPNLEKMRFDLVPKM